MLVTVRYKKWDGVDPLHKHELLRWAELKLTLWTAQGQTLNLPLAWDAQKLEWTARTTAEHENAAAMEFDYKAIVPWQQEDYTVLRIVQNFSLIARPAALPAAIDRVATPAGWVYVKPGGTRVMRTQPLGLHPLLEFSAQPSPVLTVNALMTDITELWDAMHGEGRPQQLRKAMLDPARTRFRVLAHVGGIPFVWFASIPKQAETSNEISPHVFYMPDDFGGVKYGDRTIAAIASKEHDNGGGGGRVVNNYMLDPIADDAFSSIANAHPLFRNVTDVGKHPAHGIMPLYWNTPMGMSRAVFRSGVRQVLFIPVRRDRFGMARAQTSALGDIVEAAMRVLWTQSECIALTYTKPLTVGKYVLSGYSDGGVGLWDGANSNLDRVKGIIAVEVQNMNELSKSNPGGTVAGIQVIPKLVEKGITVVLVGRHKQGNYDPKVSPAVKAKLILIPDDSSGPDKDGLDKASYAAVFAYPPDVSQNTFMMYRTYRLFEPDKDFTLRNDTAEKQLLASVKKPGMTHQQIVNRVFFPGLQLDVPGAFYHHHFAMNAGRKLKLPPLDPAEAYYKVAVEYKTFFQEALEAIG